MPEMVTRAAGESEVVVEIDWASLAREQYLSDAAIEVVSRTPEVFVGAATGTRLTMEDLREPWTRGRVRSLYRAMTSITSPFSGPEAFRTVLRTEPELGWLEDLPDAATIMEQADSQVWPSTGKREHARRPIALQYRIQTPRTQHRTRQCLFARRH